MKKNIPLKLLKQIEPKITKCKNLLTPIIKTDALYHLIDKDSCSDFYFKIYPSNVVSQYICDFKPRHSQSTLPHKSEQTIEVLSKHLDNWLNIIYEYNATNSIYDDPILKQYQDEFEAEFNLVDEDAEDVSFDLDKQLYLDSYLEIVIIKLESYKTESKENSINTIQIENLINETNTLRNEQTKLNKKEVVNRLSKLLAKARKHGLIFFKEIFVEFKKELINVIIKTFIEQYNN